MLYATIVQSEEELQQILELQKENLRGTISSNEEKEQGFVTVAHSYESLNQMHQLQPSVIVKDGDVLAGYALVMTKECSALIPELIPMFENFNAISYKGKPLNDYAFYVMGQVCVAKPYRGQGVFSMLYKMHREYLQPMYDFVVTEIATRNARSIRAHEKVGFESIYTHTDELDEWAVVVWDWRNH
jgi:GNAT superfamily N-acetyltransferase